MLQLGLAGAGAIGAKHVAAAPQAQARVVRVVDPDEERAAAMATTCGGVAGSDPRELWDDSNIDAVIIAVPNCFHKPLALEALQAGKHVLLEKPMALTAGECDELIAAADRAGRILQIGYAHRFTAVGRAAKRIVDSGELGQLRHAKAHLLLRRGIPGLGGWFTTKAIAGGGCLIDVGVHLIDLALYLLGQPRATTVIGATYADFGRRMRDYAFETMWAGPPHYDGSCDVEDSAYALVQFAGGVTLDLQVAWACNLPDTGAPTSTVALLGDRGGLSFELFGDHLRLRTETAGLNSESKLALPASNEMVEQMIDFSRAASTGVYQIGATPSEGRRVQALVDAIYASSERQAPCVVEANA